LHFEKKDQIRLYRHKTSDCRERDILLTSLAKQFFSSVLFSRQTHATV